MTLTYPRGEVLEESFLVLVEIDGDDDGDDDDDDSKGKQQQKEQTILIINGAGGVSKKVSHRNPTRTKKEIHLGKVMVTASLPTFKKVSRR